MNEHTHQTTDGRDGKAVFSRVMEHALQRPRKDRALLALYLMYGEDWVRIGKELGIGDDAARTRWKHISKRVGEAVERDS